MYCEMIVKRSFCVSAVSLDLISIAHSVMCHFFQRDFGDKRVFSERRRNDSFVNEEPEWFTEGPTSQSETIELIGFDDKILEDDKRRSKRSRKRTESLKEGMLHFVSISLDFLLDAFWSFGLSFYIFITFNFLHFLHSSGM